MQSNQALICLCPDTGEQLSFLSFFHCPIAHEQIPATQRHRTIFERKGTPVISLALTQVFLCIAAEAGNDSEAEAHSALGGGEDADDITTEMGGEVRGGRGRPEEPTTGDEGAAGNGKGANGGGGATGDEAEGPQRSIAANALLAATVGDSEENAAANGLTPPLVRSCIPSANLSLWCWKKSIFVEVFLTDISTGSALCHNLMQAHPRSSLLLRCTSSH